MGNKEESMLIQGEGVGGGSPAAASPSFLPNKATDKPPASPATKMSTVVPIMQNFYLEEQESELVDASSTNVSSSFF